MSLIDRPEVLGQQGAFTDTVAVDAATLQVPDFVEDYTGALVEREALMGVTSDGRTVQYSEVEDADRAEREEALAERYSSGEIASLGLRFLRHKFGRNWKKAVDGRQYVVAYIGADDEFSDLGRSVESQTFGYEFYSDEVKKHGKTNKAPRRYPLLGADEDYRPYDPGTVFATVLDVSREGGPVSAGSLRIIEHVEGVGHKDLNDFVADDPKNPWLDEIKAQHFAEDEPYDPMVAWQRLGAAEGVNLDPKRSLDIATHASALEYRGRHGDLDGPSMLFFHACLRYALAHPEVGENLLAIFDMNPYQNVQQYGGPFDTYRGITPQKYGGEGLTIPAFCIIERALERIPLTPTPGVGEAFVGGGILRLMALLPNDSEPDVYSNRAVGLAGQYGE